MSGKEHRGRVGIGVAWVVVSATVGAFTMGAGCSNSFEGCEASRTCAGQGNDAGADSAGAGSGGEPSGGETGSGLGGTGSAGKGGGVGQGGGEAGGGGEGAAEGGEAGGGGEGGEAPPVPDTTPPTIVSVVPASGATGVRKDANIVITFSEPMNRQRTEDAYASTRLPPTAVTFSWSADSRVLTVDPNADLTYDRPSGTRSSYFPLSAAELPYTGTVAHTAEDLAGNRLASDFPWSFWTLRRFVYPTVSLSARMVTTAGGTGVCTNAVFFVGDWPSNASYLTVASFSYTATGFYALPAGIVEFEVADFRAEQVITEGAPFGAASLGSVHLHHLGGAELNSVTWTTQPLRDLGVFSASPAVGTRSLDVRAALAEDYAQRVARGDRSTYTLRFEQFSDGDGLEDGTYYECASLKLAITYLVP